MAYVSLCKALYDYTASAEDELTFSEDALLYILDSDDAEWWKAKLKTSDDDNDEDAPIGLIPANYVEEAEPLRASRALYDYSKQNDDEIEIQEDEMLSVYEVKGEWLLVKRQQDGMPIGQLGFVPANYVDEIAAVDGVIEPMEAAPEPEPERDLEPEPIPEPRHIPLTTPPTAKGATAKRKAAVAKDDEIKMWAVSELDAKKKKKKGTLGIGNSSIFFASESDKAPVQKISVLAIVGHTVEGKGKQLNLELDEETAASNANTDDKNNIRFLLGSKSDVEEVWEKIQESQQKAEAVLEAQEKDDADAEIASASLSSPPPLPTNGRLMPSVAPPSSTAKLLPPPSRSTGAAKEPSAPPTPQPVGTVSIDGENAIALYDFEAQGDDELTVSENEQLVLVERETDDWWKVRNAAGQEGVVPASYVEVTAEEPTTTNGVTAGVGKMSVTKANEKDQSEARAAAEAAQRAVAEEERRMREEEEEAAERSRMQEERRQKAEQQRRAREAEERRRQALKAQPAPQPPRAPPTTAVTSTSTASRDVSIPSGRSAPARPKDVGKSKPNPARTRIWHDRTGQFKVEAEFLGFNQGKIRLHKLNGVTIEVAIEKMSHPDIAYLEEVTGRKLAPKRSSRNGAVGGSSGADRDRRRDEQRRRQESGRGPKRNVDWFEFFLSAGVDIDDCTRYASAFERDKIDEGILPELDASTLRSIGLREGDIIRVTKYIAKKFNKGGSTGSRSNDPAAQIRADEALARKLQEQEQAAKRNGTTPPPNLFSGPDGSLKNNTRRGRPTPNSNRTTSSGVDSASLAAASESLARTTSPPARAGTASPETSRPSAAAAAGTTNGFDDDAWTPRPASAKPVTPAPAPAAAPTPPPQQPPRPTSAATVPTPPPAPAAPAVTEPKVEAKPPADPNSALFDKLAAMKPATPTLNNRPGASPLGGVQQMYSSGPRGPFAPVASNASMLQPLIPTQSTGQFVPTGLGYQPTGMQMQPQQTGWGMVPQQTGYIQQQQPQMTGYAANGFGSMSQPQSPFGVGMNAVAAQPTGFASSMMPGAQPQAPQQTSQQYAAQQQQQKQDEINAGPDRFSAANVFGQMKQGGMHSSQTDAQQAPQSAQKYDALRPQPTGFQPGGYLTTQYTGYGGYGY